MAKLELPKGYELDLEKSTADNIVLKESKDKLPMSFEELESIDGFYIKSIPKIQSTIENVPCDDNRNIYPTRELAEAELALIPLLHIRQRWIGDWVPNWMDHSHKFIIHQFRNRIVIDMVVDYYSLLSFPDKRMADLFLETFRPELEKAKLKL